jgi:hypothetical protein
MSHYESDEGNYEDEEKEMGRYALPKGFAEHRYPKGLSCRMTDKKYDGSEEPKLWLSGYLQAVKILGGSRETTMQRLQLYLTGAARSWLSKLPDDSIGNWGKLENQFTSNL